MKINLPVYYEVNKTEQVVVAKFKPSYFDCAEYFNNHTSTNRKISPYYDYMDLTDLKGVAKCFKGNDEKPADKYDVEFGKKLAKARLIENFYWRLTKYYDDLASEYRANVLELNKFKDKAHQKSFNCFKHVNSLVEKTKEQ